MKLNKTMRERFPRKRKKRLLKSMSRNAFHAMMGWNNKFFIGCDLGDWNLPF
jgi:hypothetical protein